MHRSIECHSKRKKPKYADYFSLKNTLNHSGNFQIWPQMNSKITSQKSTLIQAGNSFPKGGIASFFQAIFDISWIYAKMLRKF